MNKFKKVMLGALSVLTLGLFAVVGTRVNAAIVTEGGSSKYLTYAVSSSSATWTLNSTSGENVDNADDKLYGLLPITRVITKGAGYWEIKKYGDVQNGKYNGCYLPVPSDASGTLTLTPNSGNSSNRQVQLYKDGLIGDAEAITKSAVTFDFDSSDLYTLDDTNYYIGFVVPNTAGALKLDSISINLTTGHFKESSGQSITYSINYAMNDGTTDLYKTDTYEDKTGDTTSHSFTFPSNPTRSGYNFMGWSASENGSILSGNSYSVSSSSNEVTLYALWVKSINSATTHVFETSGVESDYFVFCNGEIYNNNLKLTSSTSIVFKTEVRMTLVLEFDEITTTQKIVIDGNTYENVTGNSYEINLGAGSHTIARGDYEIHISSISLNLVVAEAFQQEATNQTINNKAATYIRFIAIISNVDDVKATDFTFKIYRTKDDTTQYITRTVSIYSALNLGGETYSATLPGETTAHAFDGNNGTEKYAVFVVGFTNETYKGYTVSAVFNYKGTEYTTTGYEFK